MAIAKILLAIVLCVCFCLCMVAPSFALPAVIPAVDFFSALVTTYLAARGIEVVMSQNNVASSSGNSIPADPAAQMWTDMYDRSNSRLPAESQRTLADWASWAESHVSTNIGPAGNVTPTSTTFQMSSDLVEWFDNAVSDYLTIDLGVSSDSGVYHTSGNFFDSTVSINIPADSSFLPYSPSQDFSSGLILGTGLNNVVVSAIAITTSEIYCCRVGNGFLFLSLVPSQVAVVGIDGNRYGSYSLSNSVVYDDTRIYRISGTLNGLSFSSSLPSFSSDADAYAGFLGYTPVSDTSRIQLRPQDKYNEGLRDGQGNVLPKGDVYIPDTTAEGYAPDTLNGTWNLPWADSFADSLSDVVEGIQELINANEAVLELEDVQPDPVVIPFLPPAGVNDLPSFDFNLSGIWHYVTEWVQSISSGFGLIRSVWSSLPYAMVLPIYATMVIVIVFGVYKRFIS